MSREAKIQIFQGTTPKPTRLYLQALFTKLRPHYSRLVVPCAGRFTVPQVARAAGWPAERIVASDISLFSTVVGLTAAGRPLDELDIEFSERLAHLEPYRGTEQFPAAVLFGMKWAQYAEKESYYQQSFADELASRPGQYIEAYQHQLAQLTAAIGKVDYRIRDIFAELAEWKDAGDTIVYANPPAYSRGYFRMFSPIGAHIRWADPAIPEFEPRKGVRGIFDYACTAKALTVWYRVRQIEPEEAPFATFANEIKAGQVDFCMVSRPEEAERVAAPRKVTEITPGKWPLIPYDYEIKEDSVIRCHLVQKDVALYYRELFAHKLGVVRAERYYVFTIDGYLSSVCGFHVGDALRRHPMRGFLCVFEDFGMSMPTHYARMNKLLMMCVTCQDFRDCLVEGAPAMGYIGEFGFATTCIADVPEVKAHRGVMKDIERSILPNGKYRIVSRTLFHPLSFAEVLKKWLQRDGAVKAKQRIAA
jgi:hypothetical protein